MATLSTENIWMRIPKANPERFEEMLEVKSELMSKHGDHLTNYIIYNMWKKQPNRLEWCKENYINNRALNQAKNIRKQIKDISNLINYKTVKTFLKRDPIYKIFTSKCENSKENSKRSSKEKTNFSTWKRVSMSLCSSFFYNSARRVHNANEDYLLLSDGTMVQMDPNCAFSFNKKTPEYVIFTELSGRSSARGVMRSLSEVREEWVTPYLEVIKKIREDRIAGRKGKAKGEMLQKRKKVVEEEEMRKVNKEGKVEAARMRFLNRKKLREKVVKG